MPTRPLPTASRSLPRRCSGPTTRTGPSASWSSATPGATARISWPCATRCSRRRPTSSSTPATWSTTPARHRTSTPPSSRPTGISSAGSCSGPASGITTSRPRAARPGATSSIPRPTIRPAARTTTRSTTGTRTWWCSTATPARDPAARSTPSSTMISRPAPPPGSSLLSTTRSTRVEGYTAATSPSGPTSCRSSTRTASTSCSWGTSTTTSARSPCAATRWSRRARARPTSRPAGAGRHCTGSGRAASRLTRNRSTTSRAWR